MPSRYREELVARCAGQLIVTIDAVDPCLCVYPLPEWELIEAKLRDLPSLREETRRLQRLLPDWSLPQGVCHAVFASRRGLLPAVRVFIDFLAEHLPPSKAAKLAADLSGAPRKALYGGGSD